MKTHPGSDNRLFQNFLVTITPIVRGRISRRRSCSAPGVGIAAIYGFNGLIGVEGTAIYQEEARDRERTIPGATYLSVVAIGIFYVD